jgi:Cd2+/Zn2+-exporting ATPase
VTDACCGGDSPDGPGVCAPAGPAAPGTRWRDRTWVLLSIAGAALVAAVAADALGRQPVTIAASLVTIALTIRGPARHAWASLGRRALDINTLMVIAAVGAVILGEWTEAGAVVWLFAVAHRLEARSLERARHAIRALVTLAPAVATVRREGVERDVPVDDVRVGDVVVVRPGARIPIDGQVLSGISTVDQAPVTGESFPVEKSAGDELFAATINGAGALEVAATRPAADSTLNRIVRLVEQAQRERAPIQTFVDRFARRYTPAVVLLAVAVAVIPPFVLGGMTEWTAHSATWAYRALALLVVACPCALVISTPVSVVSALTAAARAGVLIKGGASLERLAGIRSVAFDKTGTLTHGRVAVTDVRSVDGFGADGVLEVAASLESRSEHPIGRAIVSHARSSGVTVGPAAGFRALPGFGAEATVGAELAVVGSHRLFEARQLCTPSLHARLGEVEGSGASVVLVGHGARALGVIGLTDSVRSEGRRVVDELRAAGVTRVALLTGDQRANATGVSEAAGLDEAHAELLPADKVAHIARLRAEYGPVAMVGDGINDAPALASADVGIAMGAAGTDVALETADVALMSDDLTRLPFAFRLGRRAMANIRQNIALALGLKLAFVVLAIFGLATMWMAVLADTGASILVTANGLRLLREGSGGGAHAFGWCASTKASTVA